MKNRNTANEIIKIHILKKSPGNTAINPKYKTKAVLSKSTITTVTSAGIRIIPNHNNNQHFMLSSFIFPFILFIVIMITRVDFWLFVAFEVSHTALLKRHCIF